jgi:hypothetical protein
MSEEITSSKLLFQINKTIVKVVLLVLNTYGFVCKKMRGFIKVQ